MLQMVSQQWNPSNGHLKPNHDITVIMPARRCIFDAFAHLGGPQCYLNYYGLQLYFEARQNPQWVQDNDPNAEWFVG